MQPAPDRPIGPGVSLSFPADPGEVRRALAQILAAPPVARLAAEDRGTVELVLAEVLNNIVEHAYAGGTGPVEVDLAARAGGLACRIGDAGRAMPQDRPPAGDLPALPPGPHPAPPLARSDGVTAGIAATASGDAPRAAPDATPRGDGDLPEGGFGWHLIRSLTRDLDYARVKGRNRLSFVIPTDPPA